MRRAGKSDLSAPASELLDRNGRPLFRSQEAARAALRVRLQAGRERAASALYARWLAAWPGVGVALERLRSMPDPRSRSVFRPSEIVAPRAARPQPTRVSVDESVRQELGKVLGIAEKEGYFNQFATATWGHRGQELRHTGKGRREYARMLKRAIDELLCGQYPDVVVMVIWRYDGSETPAVRQARKTSMFGMIGLGRRGVTDDWRCVVIYSKAVR